MNKYLTVACYLTTRITNRPKEAYLKTRERKEKIIASIITILLVSIVGAIPFMASEFQDYVGLGGMLKHPIATTLLIICSAVAVCFTYMLVHEGVKFGFRTLFEADNFVYLLIMFIYFFVSMSISSTVTRDEIQANRLSSFRPMLKKLVQYSPFGKSLNWESVQRIDGKILILFVRDGKTGFYEDCFCKYGLPKNLQAEDHSYIDYVVYLRYVYTTTGYYGRKSAPAQRIDIESIIMNWHTKKIIASNYFMGLPPPKETSVAMPRRGRVRYEEFCQWIRSLFVDGQRPSIHRHHRPVG